jgi:hypothetical protein
VEGSARGRLEDVSSFLQIPSQGHIGQILQRLFGIFGRRYRLA